MTGENISILHKSDNPNEDFSRDLNKAFDDGFQPLLIVLQKGKILKIQTSNLFPQSVKALIERLLQGINEDIQRLEESRGDKYD